jgi:outer membrane lipoprotein LolB
VTLRILGLRDAMAPLRWALMAMLAAMLAACTTPKPIEGAGADAFSRIGRFALTVNEESGKQNAVQGGFSWSDDGRRYVLDLTNPLGSTEARVEGRPGAASLTKSDGTRLVADNPEQGGWRARLSRYDALGPQLLVLERQEPGRRILLRLVVNQP